MKTTACTSDLVLRERRGALSRDERIRLDAHLSTCASCRFERRVGADFDAVGVVRPGDDRLDAQLAGAVARRLAGARGERARAPRRAALVASVLLVAAGAAASTAWVRRERPQPAPAPAVTVAAPAAVEMAQASHRPETASPAIDALSRDPGAPSPPAASFPRAAMARVQPPPASPPAGEGAASLFESANAARRRNRFTEALSLYDELQRRYPASTEAHVSHVSLGRMLLERGLWADAVRQLDLYLAAGGTLSPEALFGKARALDALGQQGDATAAWQKLLGGYPDSVYAPQARKRLSATRSP
ncbi:MAG: zf-HC2 domain-containing protein [Polyangiaceae bacterium]|nr:zf-HC2 domain-containing protein [Polyangiaceae bacterium]